MANSEIEGSPSNFPIALFKIPKYKRTVGKDGFEPPNSEEDRFTVCCRWPLGYLPGIHFGKWDWETLELRDFPQISQFVFSKFQNSQSHLSESNQRPTDYKSVALPAELKWQLLNSKTNHFCLTNQRPSRLQSRDALPSR